MYPKAKEIEGRTYKVNREYGLKNTKLYQPSEINSFRTVELPDGVKKFRSDVSLLMHQQVLEENLSKSEIEKFVARLQVKNLPIDTSNYTDEQLMSCIRGKHIQSPSELLAWSKYLNQLTKAEIESTVNKTVKKVKDEVARQNLRSVSKKSE